MYFVIKGLRRLYVAMVRRYCTGVLTSTSQGWLTEYIKPVQGSTLSWFILEVRCWGKTHVHDTFIHCDMLQERSGTPDMPSRDMLAISCCWVFHLFFQNALVNTSPTAVVSMMDQTTFRTPKTHAHQSQVLPKRQGSKCSHRYQGQGQVHPVQIKEHTSTGEWGWGLFFRAGISGQDISVSRARTIVLMEEWEWGSGLFLFLYK